jgi:hypothetical protein
MFALRPRYELHRLPLPRRVLSLLLRARHRRGQLSPSSTREVFIRILEDASSDDQASILKGVLAKYPPDSSEKREKLATEIHAMVTHLEGAPAVSSPRPKITTDTVERAIRDAETLIQKSGATSGVDRIHTALPAT